MSKTLTQTIQNQITTQNLRISFILKIDGIDYASSLVNWQISFSKEYGSATASFILSNNNNVFGENGNSAISIGDTVEFIEKFGGDPTEFKKFYGVVNQRSISKNGSDRTITLECYDYISTLQYLDINLDAEGVKGYIEYETLSPQYLPSPNESMAQIFNFANDSIADDPRPVLVIRTKDTTLEDPAYDGFEVLYDVGQIKMGFPINALYNYDIIAKKYYYYVHGLYVEDILESILTEPDGYGNYLFGETTKQGIIDNHLTETLLSVEGTSTDTLTPNLTTSTITIETTLGLNNQVGDTSVLIVDPTGLPDFVLLGDEYIGQISINGDIFTYTSIESGNRLTGIPVSGEYSLRAHNAGSYVDYESNYPAGQVWYLKYSNIITELGASDFTIPNPAQFLYFDKRNGRIILNQPIATSSVVRCNTNYSFKTLQATGVVLNKISFRDREVENRFEALKKLRDYLAPNYVIRTLGDSKIWSSYLYQKTIADYDLELISNLNYLEDQDLYTRVKFFGKNNNPTNLMFKDGVAFITSGNPYKGTASYTELVSTRDEAEYWVYECPLGPDVDNYCVTGTNVTATGSGINIVGLPNNVRDNALSSTYGGQHLEVEYYQCNYNFSVQVTWDEPVYCRYVEAFLSFSTSDTHTGTYYIDLYYNGQWNTEQTVAYSNPSGQQNKQFSGIWALVTGIRFRAVATGTSHIGKNEDEWEGGISCLVQELKVWGSLTPTGIGKIIVETLTPTVWINNVPIDNKLHEMVYQQVIIELTTRTDTNSSSGGGKCLPAETLIEMEDGSTKKISDIVLGDIVKDGGKVLELSCTEHSEPISLYNFDFGDKQILASYYHPFNEEPKNVNKSDYFCTKTYDIYTKKGFYYSDGIKILSTLDKNYKASEIYYNKNKLLQKLGRVFNKYFECNHKKCSCSLSGCKAGGGGGGSSEVTQHTYYYYKIRFAHRNIEPSKEILIYNSLGELVYTIPANTSEMNYATGILSIPGDVQRTDLENVSKATYWVFYSSGDLTIDYDLAEFRISKKLISAPAQVVVRATFEYLAVITPVKDIASVIDGKWDTQVQTEFFSQPPAGYHYGTIDLGSIKTIQALDILAGFYKPNRTVNDSRRFDLAMALTLHYSEDGVEFHEVSDKTHNVKLAGGESASFDDSDLGTDFRARYLRIILENVGKIEFEKGVWVVAITEISAYDDIVLTGEAKLIPYTTSTTNIVIESGDTSGTYPTTVEVLSTTGFSDVESAQDYHTAYIEDDIFKYTGLTATSFTGVSGLEESHPAGSRVSQELENESDFYDYKALRPKLGDRLYKKMEVDDKKLYDQTFLDRLSKAWLREFVKNHSKATVDILYAPYLQVGQTIRLVDSFTGIDTRYFIESIQDANGFYTLSIAQSPD
jgi:hypothetical protein